MIRDRLIIRWLLLLAINVFIIISFSNKASAISGASNYFPDTSPEGQGRSYALVQVTGDDVPNKDVYIKARTTVANVYVPEDLVNQQIDLNIINACHGTTRDSSDVWYGDTQFLIHNRTTGQSLSENYVLDNPSCTASKKNIPISFTASTINPSSPFFRVSKVYDKGTIYNVYQFIANGVMAETGSNKRYLNAFGLESLNARVLVGISNAPIVCNKATYKNSCPEERFYQNEYTAGSTRSWVYSSFYGPSPASILPSYSQRIKINSSCATKGGVSFYDLDANDKSLEDQANMEIKLLKNGSPMYIETLNGVKLGSLSKTGIENWEGGIDGVLRPHPGFGGNNDQYLDLPGGDPMFEVLSKFESNTNYELQINNLDSNNSIQILPSFVNCMPPVSAFDVASCSLLAGWTFDPDVPDESIKVHVYVDGPAGGGGTFVGEYNTDGERSDVNGVFGISGRHGFNIEVPISYQSSKTHKFYLYAIGVDIYKDKDGVNAFIGEKSVGPCSSIASAKCTIESIAALPDQPVSIIMNITAEGVSGSVAITPSITTNGTTYNNSALTFTSTSLNQNSTFLNIQYPNVGSYPISGTISWSGGSSICNNIATVTLSANCSLGNILAEPNELASINMTIIFDKLYSDIVVTPSITTNGTTYNNSALTFTSTSLNQNSTFLNIQYPNVGSYPISGTISWSGGSANCAATASVVRKPFFRVDDGDLIVGGTYANPCAAPSSSVTFGNTASWAVPLLDKGASSEHVAKIFGKALGMYSANSLSPPNGMQRRWLTIANNDSFNSWGGGSGDVTCMKDIYEKTKKTNSDVIATDIYTLGSTNPSSKQLSYTGNLTLNGTNNFSGSLAVYVTGNVYITDNITMSNYTTVDTIPFFSLIVRGNIYIKSTVTNLEGMYIAQPNGSLGGTIYTCGTNGFTAVGLSNIYSDCSNPLTFKGIVQAKELKLHRSIGTLNDNVPAEIFDHSPELYLAPKPFRDDSDSSLRYDSTVTLPPLL